MRSPMLIDFSNWFMDMLSVKVLNIDFGKLKHSKTDRYRLYGIIENAKGYQKMYIGTFKPNEEYQRQIASEFQRIALKYDFANEKDFQNLLSATLIFLEKQKQKQIGKQRMKLKTL